MPVIETQVPTGYRHYTRHRVIRIGSKTLDDENSHIRAGAAVALGYIGGDAKPAIPALLVKLKDSDMFVRAASAGALAGIGVKEKKIISALKEALAEPDVSTRVDIALALAKLDPEREDDAIAIVTNVLLTDKEPGDRSSAALSLRQIKSPKSLSG